MTLKVLSRRIEGSSQAVDYKEHGKTRAHTLRVLIHADSYRFQSYGKVERWDGSAWQMVASLNGEALSMDTGIGYRGLSEPDQMAAFQPDRDRLIALASEIL